MLWVVIEEDVLPWQFSFFSTRTLPSNKTKEVQFHSEPQEMAPWAVHVKFYNSLLQKVDKLAEIAESWVMLQRLKHW